MEQAPPSPSAAELKAINAGFAKLGAEARVAWALKALPAVPVLSSSFGVQSAAMLHLVCCQRPDIPVVVVDTGYLFPETYVFIDRLRERLRLNLHVARPELSPAWLEIRHGRLWEQGVDGITRYNRLAKVEPMQRMLASLGARTWFAGLRRDQSEGRSDTPLVEFRNGRWKLHPIADWSDRDIGRYLKRHDLPYHPLWEKGYVSIGDVHTTQALQPGLRNEDTRFFGLKRECGLHLEV